MNLSDVAKIFNTTVFTDAVGANSFTGQVLPFTDNVRSGITSTRRILETIPQVTVPEVIIEQETGRFYIVANPSYDYFLSTAIRKKNPIVLAEASYTLRTLNQLLNATGGSSFRASVHYNRHEPTEYAFENIGGFLAEAPASIVGSAGQILFTGSDYYRIKEDSYLDPIGLTTFELIRIPSALQTLNVVVAGTFDPITETFTGGSTTPATCLIEQRDKSFEFLRIDNSNTEVGDVTISTLQICNVGDLIGEYKIISKRVEDSVNILHGRRE